MLTPFISQLQANVEAYSRTLLGPANTGNLKDAAASEGAGRDNEGEAPAGDEGGLEVPHAAGEEDVNVDELGK
jgi:hypothetical protein